jgi:molybdenum cofactor cytidylyltransferase
MPAVTVSAVLLAAGESRRMGAANKLLLDIGGVTVVRRTAEQILAAGVAELVAVLGHQGEAIADALDGLPLRTVVNPDYAAGQMTSVQAGLAALETPGDAAMICLADQPLLTAADYRLLIDAFADRGGKSILVPVHRGARGNPVMLAAAHLGEITGRRANLGCRQLIDRNPDLVRTVEVASDRFVRDIDTEADYRAAVG